MERITRRAPQVLGATRALLGILFACHGAQKLMGAFGGPPPGAPATLDNLRRRG